MGGWGENRLGGGRLGQNIVGGGRLGFQVGGGRQGHDNLTNPIGMSYETAV